MKLQLYLGDDHASLFLSLVFKVVPSDVTEHLLAGDIASSALSNKSELPILVLPDQLILSDPFEIVQNILSGGNLSRKTLLGDQSTRQFLDYVFKQLSPSLSNSDCKKSLSLLHKLNKTLQMVNFVTCNALTVADVALFSLLSRHLPSWIPSQKSALLNICRWYDLIQHIPFVQSQLPQSMIVHFDLDLLPPKSKLPSLATPSLSNTQPDCTIVGGGKTLGQMADVSCVDFRVGRIIECIRHPNADTLYIEKIDLGESSPRTIVSGLVKFIPLEEMVNRLVIVVANLRPAKLKDILSSGMVLAASNAEHTQVELIEPPYEAQPGDRVIAEGYPGEPEIQLNPKKKQFDQIKLHLHTNDEFIACYKESILMTPSGPCRSRTLANVQLS